MHRSSSLQAFVFFYVFFLVTGALCEKQLYPCFCRVLNPQEDKTTKQDIFHQFAKSAILVSMVLRLRASDAKYNFCHPCHKWWAIFVDWYVYCAIFSVLKFKL